MFRDAHIKMKERSKQVISGFLTKVYCKKCEPISSASHNCSSASKKADADGGGGVLRMEDEHMKAARDLQCAIGRQVLEIS
jgi:hypothetical protein